MEDRIIIRQETEDDINEVNILIRNSFWNVYRPGCSEHLIASRLRVSPCFIRELDLVMELDGRIIGQIMYVKSHIDTALGKLSTAIFGPVSIASQYQRKGLGLHLVKHSLDIASELGIKAVLIEGNPDFYRHAGFIRASDKHIYSNADNQDNPYLLAKELSPGYLDNAGGIYSVPSEYFPSEEEIVAFDKLFPPMKKAVGSSS